MYYQGKALKKRKGRMKIAGTILLLIGAAIIMAGMVMCNAKIFAHGEGACDGEWRISHTMPDWWSSQADWDLKHRHHIQRSNKRDYVQSWTNQSPQMDTFSECPETSTTDIATTSVDDETDAERTNDGYCDPEPIFSTNKAGRLASVVWLEQGTNKVCPRQPD